MNNEIHFVGNLTSIEVTPYNTKDGQSHNRVNFQLVSDERISQSLLLSVRGVVGDQMVLLDLHPGFCSIVAYIEFHTFDYNQRLCQEIRVWKLEITKHDTGKMYVITRANTTELS